ncbi:hypothetical protein CK1_05920 [Ruminococcus sp. SR1/5]|nr:hypothetical protein CK1_05920 [Ruminococcus sp. SR1/5]
MNEQKISWKRSDLKWRGKQAFKKITGQQCW